MLIMGLEYMKKKLKRIKEILDMLDIDIYTGHRKESHMKAGQISLSIIFLASMAMSVFNYISGSYIMALSTIAISICAIGCFFSVKIYKTMTLVKSVYWIMFALLMTIYAIQGSNQGFAILWSILLPMGYMFFIDVGLGICLGCFLEILYCLIFYTSYRNNLTGKYTEIFMDRFPVLFFFNIVFTSIAMIMYHKTVLDNNKKEEELLKDNEEAYQKYLDAEWQKKEVILEIKAKNKFLQKMSHEIRTPITGIVGMNELILRDNKDENIAKYAESINESCKELLLLVDGLLDAKKMEELKRANDKKYENDYETEEYLEVDLSGLRILSVDDNKINRNVIENYLKNSNCELSSAKDGNEAVQITKNQKFDIILMDHMMPHMDGAEATTIIRTDENNINHDSIIIALTANAVTGVREDYIMGGFDEYMTKPIKYNDFMLMLESFKEKINLNQKEITEKKLITKEIGLEKALGDEEFYKEILTDFYNEGSENIESLKGCYEEKNYDSYRILVHALKNNGSTIGAVDFSELSREQEYAVKDNKYTVIDEKFDDYIAYYEKLLEEIKEML